MHYDVQILGRAGRFDIERDEPPAEGDVIEAGSMVYKVLRVQPCEDEFDGVIEVEWQAGPEKLGPAAAIARDSDSRHA